MIAVITAAIFFFAAGVSMLMDGVDGNDELGALFIAVSLCMLAGCAAIILFI